MDEIAIDPWVTKHRFAQCFDAGARDDVEVAVSETPSDGLETNTDNPKPRESREAREPRPPAASSAAAPAPAPSKAASRSNPKASGFTAPTPKRGGIERTTVSPRNPP